MNANTILIVDDDAEIRELIAMYMHDHDYRTIEAADGESALRQFQAHCPDLVLLDVILPGMDGFAVARRIREQSDVPILFLTGKTESPDIVNGLTIGADDYITKPFMPDVLVARVQLQLRKSRPHVMTGVIRIGDLIMNRDTCEASFRGQSIPFLAKEFKLLSHLAERPRQVFSAEQLYGQLWNYADGDVRTVMVHISNIRKKLKIYTLDTVQIETIKGAGYRLVPAMESGHPATRPSSIRDAILEAAAELFADRGYEGMTMKEIARQVGIHASSIYAHFRNKEELLLQIYRSVLNGHLHLVSEHVGIADGTHSMKDRLDSLLRSVVQFQLKEMSKMKIYIRLLLMPSGYLGQDTRDMLLKLEQAEHRMFAAIIQTGMDRGEIQQGDSDALARLLIVFMDGVFWEMQRYDEKLCWERFEQNWQQFWRLIEAR
jgi:DNA-binding response OmpR family regulator/AcrR family transcriptional regulator